MDRLIAFNRPHFDEQDIDELRKAVLRHHAAGGGPASAAAEHRLREMHGCSRALVTTSCTHALELAAILGRPEPGDEIIVPAFAFVSTASAFLLHGWTPVFADVRQDTLNLDVDAVQAAITPRTRAVCTVNYAGVGADLDRLAVLCERFDLLLIEDNAHGLGGGWGGRTLGTFGALSTLSFHETKNVTCGEGGALIINDAAFGERAEILREKGTDRSRFLRGQVDKYTWVEVGSSWVLSDLLAAILVSQLSRLDSIQERRHAIWAAYRDSLTAWAEDRGIRLPVIPPEAEHTAHMFHLRLRSLDDRTAFIRHLAGAGVSAVFHYQPLHLSDVGRRLGGCPGQFPVTEDAGDTLVRLPLFPGLSDTERERIIDAVKQW